MYILFLNDGVPKVRYFSVESVKNVNAAVINESIQTAPNRFGITKFASVSVDHLNLLGKSVKDSAP